MKTVFKRSLILIMILSCFITINSCKKDKPTLPVLTTKTVTEITSTTAISGGIISATGGVPIIARGICWSTSINPTTIDNITVETVMNDSFTSNITGLEGGKLYYVRAYATNTVGTGYGTEISFTTLGQVPSVTTLAPTSVTTTSATLNGTVNANYLSTIVTFEYGLTTSYGSTKTPSQSPVDGNSAINVSANITGLTEGTTYHFRVKTVNALGTVYGNDLTLTTLGQIPTAATLAATSVTNTSATLNGTVNANYLSTIVTFEYGTTITYGNILTATQSTVTGNSMTNINVSVIGLTAGTTYHYRVKAVNSLGTTNGNDMTITTTIDGVSGTVTDYDGNSYKTIGIGNQMWMAENLKTTKYNDGTSILLVNDNDAWRNLVTAGYSWYNNDEASYKATYGALYNGYTVNTGKLCPTGWHIPTRTEWSVLVTYLGGFLSDAGGKLKEAGTTHWLSPNTGATNESGFTGLPGGSRDYYWGSFGYGPPTVDPYGFWWTSTIDLPNTLWYHSLHYWDSYVGGSAASLKSGFSVRCIKD